MPIPYSLKRYVGHTSLPFQIFDIESSISFDLDSPVSSIIPSIQNIRETDDIEVVDDEYLDNFFHVFDTKNNFEFIFEEDQPNGHFVVESKHYCQSFQISRTIYLQNLELI